MTEPTGPLKGLRILDLTTVLFGPFGTQTLGDWGAEVIKVESLTGDTWRTSGQFRNRGMSGQFMAANRNKRSIALDLKHPDGKAVLRRLIPTADALVSNIRPAGLERLGFGYEACRELNQRIVYASAVGFGQDGPWRARPAFDEIIQAASGFASAMGTDEEPAFVPSLIGDKICGMALTSAVTAALLHRERTGEGQMVEVPMLETLAAFNSIEMFGGQAFVPSIGPSGYKRMKARRPVRTKDGWLTMLPYSGATTGVRSSKPWGIRSASRNSRCATRWRGRATSTVSTIACATSRRAGPRRNGRNCCCGSTCRTRGSRS